MRTRALVAAVLLALAPLVLAADAVVKEFKKEWDAAASLSGAARGDAQVKALERLRSATSVDAAQATLNAALDANAEFVAYAAARDILRGASADPVKAWAAKQLAGDKDARARALLAGVVVAWDPKPVLGALKDKEPSVVSAAAIALAPIKSKDVISGLVAALKDKDGRAAEDIVLALRALTKKAKLKEASEWEAWWSASKEGFSFDAPAEEAPAEPAAASGGAPRTTSNGSGIYETISSNRVIFVIDTSFSMRITGDVEEGAGRAGTAGPAAPKKQMTRLEFVQRELCAAIENQLTKKCLFNVISYSTKVTPWKPKLVEASDANRKAAKAWVMALAPDDETNVFDALEMALQDKQVDTIYLLSDGFPTKGRITNMDTIRTEIKRMNASRNVRIHTIAYVVGDGTKFNVTENKDMSKNFMKALAEEAGGTFKGIDDPGK
jgi:hypothetical protein